MPAAKSSETTRKMAAHAATVLVRRVLVAEGKVLKSNGLLGERGRRRCNSRLGVGQLLSTFQLGLHDAVFGRQVFVPRQQLLVHRPRHVSQDARLIRKRPLPYPDSATASWTVREIVLNRLRNYYRRRPNHCSPAVSVFWPYEMEGHGAYGFLASPVNHDPGSALI